MIVTEVLQWFAFFRMQLDNLCHVVDSLTAGASSLGTCLHELQLV
jgi:hypothetical protein